MGLHGPLVPMGSMGPWAHGSGWADGRNSWADWTSGTGGTGGTGGRTLLASLASRAISMEIHVNPWNSMDIHCYPWVSMDIHELLFWVVQ